MDASVICAKIARMKRVLAILSLLALAACQPQDPNGKAAPAPADEPADAQVAENAPSDFSKPMTARGTEPFWSLSIDGAHFTFSRPGQPDLVAEAPGAAIQPGRATWIAKAADGAQLTVILYVSECSDGMSDHRYPMSAEVTLLNHTLHGCAAKTAEMPRSLATPAPTTPPK